MVVWELVDERTKVGVGGRCWGMLRKAMGTGLGLGLPFLSLWFSFKPSYGGAWWRCVQILWLCVYVYYVALL